MTNAQENRSFIQSSSSSMFYRQEKPNNTHKTNNHLPDASSTDPLEQTGGTIFVFWQFCRHQNSIWVVHL